MAETAALASVFSRPGRPLCTGFQTSGNAADSGLRFYFFHCFAKYDFDLVLSFVVTP